MKILELIQQPRFTTRMRAGGSYVEVDCAVKGNRLWMSFPYYDPLVQEIKSTLEKRKWEADDRCWSVPISSQRNLFRLEHMLGKYGTNPYSIFDQHTDYTDRINEHLSKRGIKSYKHQLEMLMFGLNRRHFVWAADMGLGKTLSSILLMEILGIKTCWWVSPKAPLVGVRIDFEKWQTEVKPFFMTYEYMKTLIDKWTPGDPAPQAVFFDEASKLKNPQAQRTIAARHLADSVRAEHGYNSIIALLSGTPAPKSPVDWWSLGEIVAPGYIREGSTQAFTERLAFLEKTETVFGAGAYQKIVGWRDSESKCKTCGADQTSHKHSNHSFQPSTNEVAGLRQRLKPIVGVWLKEDCLDLPEKRYEIREVKPTRKLLQIADLITKKSKRAIEALTLLRELSDGFQYMEKPTGEKRTCDCCQGHGQIPSYFSSIDPTRILTDEEVSEQCQFNYDPETGEIVEKIKIELITSTEQCPVCNGAKLVDVMEHTITETPCPKDDVLIDLLEEHEEVGRLNVYGGFTGTLDRIVKICHKQGWSTLRVDGRGWHMSESNGRVVEGTNERLLAMYMKKIEGPSDIVFVGNPDSAGMGLTLTVSPSTFFFSNTFNGESRLQAEDRGHRIGMDVIRGGRIIDCIHLPTDLKVLNNLKLKKDLQRMTMRGLIDAFKESIGVATE